MEATHKKFTPPYQDKNLKLGEIIQLKLHEFSGEVEDICDASAKELKIEKTVAAIKERWTGIVWLMDPYKDTDVPLLKIGEEDFEALGGGPAHSTGHACLTLREDFRGGRARPSDPSGLRS